MYMWTKKRAVWGLTTRKSPVSVIYCSLVKFNGQKRGLLCQAIRSGKGIWNHSINGTEKGSGKLYSASNLVMPLLWFLLVVNKI